MAPSPGQFVRAVRKAFIGDGTLATTTAYPASSFPAMGFGWDTLAGFTSVSDVGDGSRNSIVVGALNVLKTRFPEPTGKVFERADGPEAYGEEVRDHRLTDLISRPNPYMLGEDLWQYVMHGGHVAGDAYWLKNRSAAGSVVELWPLHPDLVEPLPTRDFSARIAGTNEILTLEDNPFIGVYRYTIDGAEHHFLPEDIVHFKPLGLDPNDFRHGFAPIRHVLRELVGDEAASQFQTALLKNMGFPGLVFSPKVLPDGVEYPGRDAANRLKSEVAQEFGGHKRGSTMVLRGPMDVTTVGLNPSELDLRTAHFHAEERVSSVLGVPAVLAALGAGIESSSGKSETVELIRDFTEGKLVPLWRKLGAEVTEQLLIPDFEGNRSRNYAFDLRSVKALQENRLQQVEAEVAAFQGGVATRKEAREGLGLQATDSDDVYLVPGTSSFVGRDEEPLIPRPIPSLNGGEAVTADELADLLS